jgi:hypothetical protein
MAVRRERWWSVTRLLNEAWNGILYCISAEREEHNERKREIPWDCGGQMKKRAIPISQIELNFVFWERADHDSAPGRLPDIG